VSCRRRRGPSWLRRPRPGGFTTEYGCSTTAPSQTTHCLSSS